MSDALSNREDPSKEKIQQVREFITSVKNKLTITKVIATRSVKGPGGDSFVGFAAEWDSLQDDGTQGLTSMLEGHPVQAMTMKEAKVAACLLGLQADVAAYRNAMCSGAISPSLGQDRIKGSKANYSKVIQEILDEV